MSSSATIFTHFDNLVKQPGFDFEAMINPHKSADSAPSGITQPIIRQTARGGHEVSDLAPLMLKFLIAANAAARARRLAFRRTSSIRRVSPQPSTYHRKENAQ